MWIQRAWTHCYSLLLSWYDTFTKYRQFQMISCRPCAGTSCVPAVLVQVLCQPDSTPPVLVVKWLARLHISQLVVKVTQSAAPPPLIFRERRSATCIFWELSSGTGKCRVMLAGDRSEVEQGLTCHWTHYRSYRGWVFTDQMTQPTVSKHWRKMFQGLGFNPTRSTPPCYNNTTHMQ